MVLLSIDASIGIGVTVEEVLGPGPKSQLSRGSVLVSIGMSSTKLLTEGASSFLPTVLGLFIRIWQVVFSSVPCPIAGTVSVSVVQDSSR